MAAKLIIGTRQTLTDGRVRASMVFLFPLVDFGGRIKDASNVDVVPAWDYGAIPAPFATPQAWITAMGAGDAGFLLHTMEQRNGETLAAFQTAVWATYNVLVPLEVARRRDEAAGTGAYNLQRFTLNG